MRLTRTGQQWYFATTFHLSVNSQSGLTHSAVVIVAQVHDQDPVSNLLHGEGRRACGDSVFANAKDLTVAAIKKEDPGYKGRIFNKLINNGSKSQYQKRATDKFLFNGVAELILPFWYTSRTCLKHSIIVEKTQKG